MGSVGASAVTTFSSPAFMSIQTVTSASISAFSRFPRRFRLATHVHRPRHPPTFPHYHLVHKPLLLQAFLFPSHSTRPLRHQLPRNARNLLGRPSHKLLARRALGRDTLWVGSPVFVITVGPDPLSSRVAGNEVFCSLCLPYSHPHPRATVHYAGAKPSSRSFASDHLRDPRSEKRSELVEGEPLMPPHAADNSFRVGGSGIYRNPSANNSDVGLAVSAPPPPYRQSGEASSAVGSASRIRNQAGEWDEWNPAR